MIGSANSPSSINVQQLMAGMFEKIHAADTDGIAGLSKAELSSINTNEDVNTSKFIESLNEQFIELDKNGNGQLSDEEMAMVKVMGPPPGFELNSIEENASKDKLMELLLNSLAESYGNNDEDKEVKGLSAEELSSIKTENGTNAEKFVNNLIENFDTFDTNNDQILSASEIKASLNASETASEDSESSVKSLLGDLSGSFVQKLFDKYKDNLANLDLSSLTSSLNLSI